MALVSAAGLATAGIGYRVGVAPVVTGLFAFGVGNGTWDVAMNVEGSAVEQEIGRAIMPRFHAGFSVGTVAGALGGAAMVALGVSATAHLLVVAAIVAVAGPLAVRDFLPDVDAPTDEGERRSPLKAWTEPRTLLIGLFVFAAAFTEGTGNDWLGVAVIDGYGAAAALGALTFAIFLAAMTLGRWFGPGLIDRHGRVLTVRIFGALALAGLALVVWGATLPVAMAGAALWGLGTALGFPSGDERGGGRFRARRGARERGGHDRLRRVPRRAAPHRLPRRAHRDAARADRDRRPRRARAHDLRGAAPAART